MTDTVDSNELEALEDVVFSVIPPGDVHFILSEWSGTSYPLLIEALGLYLRLKEVQKAAEKRLTLEEMALVRNVGTYTLQ